ncbi:hypothetical protein HX744_20020 [Pseudonocardia sp. ICBG1122]|nr:hypothetical protein [Pseudonocardia pini]
MGSLHRRRDLLAEGHTDEGVRAAIRAGRLTRVRPGVYVEPDDPSQPDTDARHRRLVEATLPLLAPGAVLSHATAVVMHGLPSWGIALRRMHVTRDLPAGGRAGRHVHLHAAPLPAGDVVTVGTTPVTAVARTVVDVARSCSFESAVTVADAALLRGYVTVDELAAAVGAAALRRGVARARAVLAVADGRADGPGESRSRVRMRRAGLPAPELQHVVRDARGRHVGRVDSGGSTRASSASSTAWRSTAVRCCRGNASATRSKGRSGARTPSAPSPGSATSSAGRGTTWPPSPPLTIRLRSLLTTVP